MRKAPTSPSSYYYNYRLAALDFSSIANDCDAFAARVATVLQAAATTSSNQTYELSTRPPPPISRQQLSPGL